jgi:hypothetical protein
MTVGSRGMRKERSDHCLVAAAQRLVLSLSFSLVADAAACRLHVGMKSEQWRGWSCRGATVSASW